MKARLNLTIDKQIVEKMKQHARQRKMSLSQLVEQYFQSLITTRKRKSIRDIMDQLPKPKLPLDIDYRKEYYEAKGKKYGL
jgi:Family of unknown function (DUF6364)